MERLFRFFHCLYSTNIPKAKKVSSLLFSLNWARRSLNLKKVMFQVIEINDSVLVAVMKTNENNLGLYINSFRWRRNLGIENADKVFFILYCEKDVMANENCDKFETFSFAIRKHKWILKENKVWFSKTDRCNFT